MITTQFFPEWHYGEKSMGNIKCDVNNCKHNCCASFNGVSETISPFGKSFKFSDIILSKDDCSILIDNGYQYMIESKNGINKLKTLHNGLCSALKNNRCSIYEYRPTVCRAFPFYIDMFAGLCTITDCCVAPKEGKIIDYSEEIKAAISVYKNWIEYYEDILNEAK